MEGCWEESPSTYAVLTYAYFMKVQIVILWFMLLLVGLLPGIMNIICESAGETVDAGNAAMIFRELLSYFSFMESIY